MAKVIDMNMTVKDICSKYPEMLEILKQVGFEQITSPGMLNTAGRFMTIPKGAAMKGIDVNKIKDKFKEAGFEVKD